MKYKNFLFIFLLSITLLFSSTSDEDQQLKTFYQPNHNYNITDNLIRLSTSLRLSTPIRNIDGDNNDIANNNEVCVGSIYINTSNQIIFAVNNQFSNQSVGFITNTFDGSNYGNYNNPVSSQDSNIPGYTNIQVDNFGRPVSGEINTLANRAPFNCVHDGSCTRHGYRKHLGLLLNLDPSNYYFYKSALFCDGEITLFKDGLSYSNMNTYDGSVFEFDLNNAQLGQTLSFSTKTTLDTCYMLSILVNGSNDISYMITGGNLSGDYVSPTGNFVTQPDAISFKVVDYKIINISIDNIQNLGNNVYQITMTNHGQQNYIDLEADVVNVSTNISGISAVLDNPVHLAFGQTKTFNITMNTGSYIGAIRLTFDVRSTKPSCWQQTDTLPTNYWLSNDGHVHQNISEDTTTQPNGVDYRIINIYYSIPDSSVQAGDVVNVSFEVENWGLDDYSQLTDGLINVTPAGQNTQSFNSQIPGLSSNQRYNISAQFICTDLTKTTQLYGLAGDSDFLNNVDVNPINNHLSDTYHCALISGVDYKITNIYYSIPDSSVQAGDIVNVTVEVKNIGADNYTEVTHGLINVTPEDDDSQEYIEPIPSLDSQEVYNITEQFVCMDLSKSTNISAMAGYQDQVFLFQDIYLPNNYLNSTYQCALRNDMPDYLISNVSFSSSNPQVGDQITVNITIKNNGNEDATQNSTTLVNISGTNPIVLPDSIDTPPINASSEYVLQRHYTCVDTNSPHTFVFTADSADVIEELNENNNEYTTQYPCVLVRTTCSIDITAINGVSIDYTPSIITLQDENSLNLNASIAYNYPISLNQIQVKCYVVNLDNLFVPNPDTIASDTQVFSQDASDPNQYNGQCHLSFSQSQHDRALTGFSFLTIDVQIPASPECVSQTGLMNSDCETYV